MENKVRLSVLRRRIDFLELQKTGFRVRPSDWLLMNYVSNSQGTMRCGWTLPRHVGSAVIRNKLKRWSRVFFRQMLISNSQMPVDINLVFRKTEGDFYKKLNYEQFAQVLERGCGQIRRRLR